MKLAFSNIAWARHDDPDVLSFLKRQHITGIEIAPTRIWPNWAGATVAAARRYGSALRELGFDVPALQAVLFARPDARLFSQDGQPIFISHLTHVAELAEALGAPAVVLGAPRQRDRGSLAMDQALDRASEVFHRLAETFSACNTCLCIEPNPRNYGCNFIVNAREGVALVRRVNHCGFGLHLDSAAMFLEGDDLETAWSDAGGLLKHFHISEPNLSDFCEPQVPHQGNLTFLSSRGYSGWCSVEMREPVLPLSVAGPWPLLTAVK